MCVGSSVSVLRSADERGAGWAGQMKAVQCSVPVPLPLVVLQPEHIGNAQEVGASSDTGNPCYPY